jgi:hypothetical protein
LITSTKSLAWKQSISVSAMMSESENREAHERSAESTLRAVDPRLAEARFIEASGADFTEAKEAIVDALLRLTERRCTGEGSEGEVIYGVRPSAKLVSGFLLPRFDRTGQEDETSDIHIATMGLDLQIAAGQARDVIVRPSFSIYIRELPSWQEISDPRHEMMPQVQLSRDARQMVEQRARAYIQERIGDLPALDEDDEQEKAGNALAQAATAREAADASEEARTEAGADDPEARGTERATAEIAERADRAARAHQHEYQRRAASRQVRIAERAAIRREEFDRAFAELGIRLVTTEAGVPTERTVTSDDLDEAVRSEIIEAGIEEVEAQDVAAGAHEEDPEEGPPPVSGAIRSLRSGCGRIDDHFAAPQPIPQKWRRMPLELGEVRFDISDGSARDVAITEFQHRFNEQLQETIASWLSTEQGQRDAYRPNERMLPSQFADEDSWNRYLTDLRTRRPATPDDVRPDLNGVGLVADLDPDFVDRSRMNLRLAIQNDASMPAGLDASGFEHAIFQVQL